MTGGEKRAAGRNLLVSKKQRFVCFYVKIHPSLFPITSESPYLCAGKDSAIKQSTDFSGFLQGKCFHGVRAPVIFLSLTLKRHFL